MISRVPFATPTLVKTMPSQTMNFLKIGSHPKAFRVFPDGLVAVPFTAAASTYYGGDTCNTLSSGIQLVDWQSDQLVGRKRFCQCGEIRAARSKRWRANRGVRLKCQLVFAREPLCVVKTADVTD